MWPLPFSEVAAFLRKHGSFYEGRGSERIEISGAFTDSRKPLQNGLFVAIQGGNFDGHDFVEELCNASDKNSVWFLVKREWLLVKKDYLVDKFGLQFVEDHFFSCTDTLNSFRGLAAEVRNLFKGVVVGIGGSNGKTTTKEMIAALLGKHTFKTQKSENGYLGVALTLCSSQITKETEFLVLEIGIDEIGAMEKHLEICKPDVVCLTALGPEHLSKLLNWENCVSEEFKMFESPFSKKRVWQLSEPKLKEKSDGAFGIRASDVVVSRFFQNLSGEKPDCQVVLDAAENRISPETIHFQLLGRNSQSKFALSCPLPGDHNAENLNLAIGVAFACGLNVEKMESNWKNFSPPEMRSEILEVNENLTIYNDCYNSSPSSLKVSLETFWKLFVRKKEREGSHCFSFERVILVLGDMLDLGNESEKWHKIAATYIANVCLQRGGFEGSALQGFSESSDESPDECGAENRTSQAENLKTQMVHLCLYGNSMYTTLQELSLLEPTHFSQGPNLLTQCGSRKIFVEHLSAEKEPNGFGVFLGTKGDSSSEKKKKTLVLVKGSRGMKLDRVVAFLKSSESKLL